MKSWYKTSDNKNCGKKWVKKISVQLGFSSKIKVPQLGSGRKIPALAHHYVKSINSKANGRFFLICGPSQNIWTLYSSQKLWQLFPWNSGYFWSEILQCMSKFLLLNLGGFSSTRWAEFFWLQDKSLTLVTSSPKDPKGPFMYYLSTCRGKGG